MQKILNDNELDILFRQARTFSYWRDKNISDTTLLSLYDLVKMGPTSANCCPARFAFIKSEAAKEMLKPCLDKGNVRQTMAAPVTVIIAHDMEFYEQLPKLYPHTNARDWFAGYPKKIEATAFRNGSLQGAYLIMAARALGLDCGPMSGFNNKMVDETFFSGSSWKSNFLCNLGYGDPDQLHPRSPRLEFEEACLVA